MKVGYVCSIFYCGLYAITSQSFSQTKMALSSAREELEKLELSDEDTETLWASPSKRPSKLNPAKSNELGNRDESISPHPRNEETDYDREQTRETALRNELESVRNINEVVEGVIASLDRAKGNMEVSIYPTFSLLHFTYYIFSLSFIRR